jgi:DNA-directed RNA polymerase specialized sigma24 family protein
MAYETARNGIQSQSGRLLEDKQTADHLGDRAIWRVLQTLPLRDRCLLRLLYRRGATQSELAGALGISRYALRRILRRVVARARDPLQNAIVTQWDRLTPWEQRLAYLHRILGLSLREIARHGLVESPTRDGRSGGAACVNTLRARMRRIEARVRATSDRLQPPDGAPSNG